MINAWFKIFAKFLKLLPIYDKLKTGDFNIFVFVLSNCWHNSKK